MATTPPATATQTGRARLSGPKKAAALLIALGQELASSVFRALREDEIDAVAGEILKLEKLPPEVLTEILEEAFAGLASRQAFTEGGEEIARQALARALGTQKAGEVLARATVGARPAPFDFIRQADPVQLIAFLENEHPQTIALILSHLPPDLSAKILGSLSFELQSEVAGRIARMDRTAPEIAREVETVLKQRLAAFSTTSFRSAGGLDFLVKMMNSLDARTERTIMDKMERDDPELAAEIKKRMFVFENIVQLDDRSIQRVLRDVNPKDLALALKGSDDSVKDRILKNMSRRASQLLSEDIAVLGPVRLRVVEEAQAKIVNVIRTLQEAEEIVISRGGGGEDVFV